MDGASPETYNRYRQNGRFQQVVEGLQLLIQEKQTLHSEHPRVDLQFIVMRHNEHEIDAMEHLARELGVDKLTLKTVQVSDAQEAQEFLPKQIEFRRYLHEGENIQLKGNPKNGCRWLWFCPVVNWDGTVVPCCFDKDNEVVLGHVFEESSLTDVWYSPTYNSFRKKILRDRNGLTMCTNCSEGLKSLYITKKHVNRVR
jgi:radical SAM protein with 4Fe4S-binding SPASM domain